MTKFASTEKYLVLSKNEFSKGNLKIIPLRYQDRYPIMKWRNDQIYHLRQQKLLTEKEQDIYFNKTIKPLFNSQNPNQILFSYIQNNKLIGYGGMVYVDWKNLKSEISFLLSTELKKDKEIYSFLFFNFIELIKDVAFNNLSFYKIYTETYSIRTNQLKELTKCGFELEGIKRKSIFDKKNCKFYDSYFHSIINPCSK